MSISISGLYEFKVTVEQTDASQRNKLDTKEKSYKLVLDGSNQQIVLEKHDKHKRTRETILVWPLPYIRR